MRIKYFWEMAIRKQHTQRVDFRKAERGFSCSVKLSDNDTCSDRRDEKISQSSSKFP